MEERNSREDLSALMDGELGTEPARFLLRRMEHDPELARAWSRWHLIRACLDAKKQTTAHSDSLLIDSIASDDVFVARVMGAVRQQPRRHWARYIGGGAIAASVAVAALILSVPQSTSTDNIESTARDARAVSAIPAAPVASRIAAASGVGRSAMLPWLDNRQSAFLAARPGDAMTSSYLQQAAYAPDSAPMLVRDPHQQFNGAPYMILLVPEQNATAQPRH